MKMLLTIVAIMALFNSGAAYPSQMNLEAQMETDHLGCSQDTRSMNFNNKNIQFRLCTYTYSSSHWDGSTRSWVAQEQKQHCVKPESEIDSCQTNYRQKCKSAHWANLFITFTVCQDGLRNKICYATNYGECPNLDVNNHHAIRQVGSEEECFCQQTDDNGIHCEPQGCHCDQQLTDVLKQVLESEKDCFCEQTDNGGIQCTPEGCQYRQQSMNSNRATKQQEDENCFCIDSWEGKECYPDGCQYAKQSKDHLSYMESEYSVYDSGLLEPGEMLFGDMILTQDQVRAKMLAYSNEVAGTQLWVTDVTKKWPKGHVPYEKDSSLTPAMSKAVDDALREYHGNVCLEFYERTNEKDYVVFKKGNTCRSNLGRKGGVQYIELSDRCHDKVAVMHEIGHAIGREHEHQRWDRDTYVTVNWDNIVGGKNDSAFDIFPRSKYNDQGMHYDLRSIMHYPKNAHVKQWGLACMTPKPFTGVSVDEMGAQHPDGTFSEQDKISIKAFYGCSME